MRNSTKWAGPLLALFFCAALLRGDDKPWKKPYQEWNDQDVQSIMSDSPWVRKTFIQRTWVDSENLRNVPPQQQISGGVRTTPNAAGTTAANPKATNRADQEETQAVNISVNVYWDSSRVMRAASARQMVLHGQMKDSEVEQYVNAPQEEYQIVLSMGDMTPFMTNEEKFFQANAFLEMKRSKLKLPPSRVVYQKDSNGVLKQAAFFFPKKTSSGPTIGGDETDIAFKCKIRDSTVHVDFKPQKMTAQSGPDL
ncbi:MAG TPA: hypothetical protein VEJ67_12635 [Candidatus Cybelea sp.]|nr:hypothetical protein [Candidatus Cybelea sp.]